jgi:transposase
MPYAKLNSPIGRESIPPEQPTRALLLQAFYSIRWERQLVERIDHDLMFRWFVGLGIEDAVWDATSFAKNRDRRLEGEWQASSRDPISPSRSTTGPPIAPDEIEG